MVIRVWGATDKGLKRDSNQDSYFIDNELQLYIIADGMGGHQGGEIASQMAIEETRSIIKGYVSSSASLNRPREIIQKAYSEASRAIFLRAKNQNPELQGMGTTMVLIWIYRDILYIGNVGDSRAYLFRKPFLWQVTEDHSLVNEQIRIGLSPVGTPKNVITRSVGFFENVTADIIERPLQRNESYLICSDGLSGLVDDESIAKIIEQTPSPEIPKRLIQEALKKGGHDNVTVIWMDIV